MNPLMRESVNKLQIFYGVILFVAVYVVDEISDGNRTVVFAPDSPMRQLSVGVSDISLGSYTTLTMFSSFHTYILLNRTGTVKHKINMSTNFLNSTPVRRTLTQQERKR